MHFKSIRTKLIVNICALTLCLVLLLQAVNIVLLQNAFSKLVPASMESSLLYAHEQISSKLDENFAALDTIANMPFIRDTSLTLKERAQSLADFIEDNADKGYQACAVTDRNGKAVLSSGFEINVSEDAYFQQAIKGEKVVSDPFYSRATGNLLIVYAVPYYRADGSVAGVITLDVDALHLSRDFALPGLGESGVAFAIAKDGTTVVSTDLNTVAEQLNDFNEVQNNPSLAGLVESEKKMVQGQAGNGEHQYLGTTELIYYMPVKGTSWSIAVTQAKLEAFAAVNTIIYSGLVVLVLVIILSIVAGIFLARSISRPIGQLASAANDLALGDVAVNIEVEAQDEIGVLATAFRGMAASISRQAEIISQISDGDYTVSIPIRSEKDVMNKAINHMLDRNNVAMREIRVAAEQVASGSMQIASGSQVLATGSTQQAAVMEEFSASIHEVYAKAEANTQLANVTLGEASEAGHLMEESLTSMQEMTQAMQDIDDSSQRIASVIKIIDDIAFQTNILALNAAVEAARAGQHGKGFAVVADEVRNLAGKSSEAAKETAELIQASSLSVSRGVQIADKTGEQLSQVGAIVSKNAEAMQKVSEASSAQSTAVSEINQGISQITDVVQANSATAEESAASAQELNAQSTLLNQIVARFKLRDEHNNQSFLR